MTSLESDLAKMLVMSRCTFRNVILAKLLQSVSFAKRPELFEIMPKGVPT